MLVKLRIGSIVAAGLFEEHKCSGASSGSSGRSVTARRNCPPHPCPLLPAVWVPSVSAAQLLGGEFLTLRDAPGAFLATALTNSPRSELLCLQGKLVKAF